VAERVDLEYDCTELAAIVQVEREAHAEYDRLVKKPSDAIKSEHANVCSEWREATALAKQARTEFERAYSAAMQLRLEAIASGIECDPPELPGGLKVSTRKAVQITDASAVPVEFRSVDEAKVKAALDRGERVPGAEYVPRYSVEVPK
jgi:hypothetical protein